RFDFVEIVKLIEAKDAELPQALVEELAFINHQFAANDFVAGGGVAAEVDAVDVVLFLFVEAERQVDDLVGIVYFGVRLRREINEAVLAINLAVAPSGDERNAQAGVRGVHIFENGLADGNLEVAVVAVESANADFEVFAQFLPVVGFREHRDIHEIKRDGIRAVVAHGANEFAIAESVIALKFDFADFDLGAF